MVVIVAPERAEEATRMLAAAGDEASRASAPSSARAAPDAPGCVVENLSSWGLTA
jgi:hypothetical protein